jgi:cytochrome c biogenesis protein CcdA
MHGSQDQVSRIRVVERAVRLLAALCLVAAALFVASLLVAGLSYDLVIGFLSDKGLRVINAVLIGTVMVCSGLIAAHEFWLNPLEDTERGEWTNRQLLYAGIFGISLFLSFWFVPAAYFAP